MLSKEAKKTIALLGSTGRTGGWVLEDLIAKGYNVRVLVRNDEKLKDYRSKPNLTIIRGDALSENSLKELIQGCSILISCLGSPNKTTLIMTPIAKALVNLLEQEDEYDDLRILWMTSEGVNDGVPQARKMGCGFPCCGWGCIGFMQYHCLIPYIISWGVWNDMATSEDVFTATSDEPLVDQASSTILKRTVLVRPQIMQPQSEHPTFSDQWRKEGGDIIRYVAQNPSTNIPPNNFINRRSISKFFVDAIEDEKWDGTAVHLYQG